MAIINRDLSESERRAAGPYQAVAGPTATGVTGIICAVPYAASLDVAVAMAFGTSGSPTVQLFCNRFIPGTGFTAFSIGGALTVAAYGTSGVGAATFGMSLPVIGSTLTQLQAGDVLLFQTGGSNSAVTGLVIDVVLRPLADRKTYYGIL